MRSARPSPGAHAMRSRRALLHALIVVALVALATFTIREQVVDEDAAAQATIPGHALRVNIGSIPISRPIAPGFVGFSIEYRSLLPYSGSDPARPNDTFTRLVRALAPGASPVIRFGGDTTDWTWWPTPGLARPPGIRYTLTKQWLAMARSTAEAIGARLILGINFEADSRTLAASEAHALLRGIGSRFIAGFELGNEPEVYGALGWYTTPAGVSVPGRRAGYGVRSFVRDYATISSALPRDVPLVGPASGGGRRWIAGLGRYLAANPRVRVVTFHRYPLHRCFTPVRSATYPTIPHLLGRDASRGLAAGLRTAVAVAHEHGRPFRLDELNNVSCGGKRNVSNTFASALWALDTLFNVASVGADGVNIHTFSGARYAPFAFSRSAGEWQAQVRPMYYGLLMFARAAPAGSRLLPVSRVRGAVRIWATRGPGGTVRIVLINDSPRRATTVAVRPPVAAAAATVQRLRAPGLRATSHVTLAGQSFGATSKTGALLGSPRTFTVHPIEHRYVVALPPASAALITLASR